jgi:hypothetical protein
MEELSSGEVVFHLVAKAAAEIIAVCLIVQDLGWDADLKFNADARVAESMVNLQGIGKIRHLEVRFRFCTI